MKSIRANIVALFLMLGSFHTTTAQEFIYVKDDLEIPKGIPYKQVLLEDGTVGYRYPKNATASNVTRSNPWSSTHSGALDVTTVSRLISLAGTENVDAIVGQELLPDQKQKLAAIAKEFPRKLEGAKLSTEKGVVLAEYVSQIREILLEEQIDSLAKLVTWSNVLDLARSKQGVTFLNLSAQQSKALSEKSEIALAEIEAAQRQIEEIEERCRKQALAILSPLSDEQLSQLEGFSGKTRANFLKGVSLERLNEIVRRKVEKE